MLAKPHRPDDAGPDTEREDLTMTIVWECG
jgi:hypothetical protein